MPDSKGFFDTRDGKAREGKGHQLDWIRDGVVTVVVL